ncbi:hypothetical protein [Pseudacidovorax sp. NFM-22]|uniref:hypothetical protein n=1 Tax=Pseudacidovorax sp. NFM-22 TaxID=2744469 RepID=UPI001F478D17|nr:hypothetical protein [Pseudacidovorax sp. NFM-22]
MLMRPFVIVDECGRQVMAGMSPQPPACPAGCTLLGLEPPTPASFWDFAAQDWREPAPRPTAHHVFDWAAHDWIDPRTVKEVRAAQLRALNAAFEAAAAALTAGYPASERQTWPLQQEEAMAWHGNPGTPTPYLDGIAAVRGIAPEDMRAKTRDAVLQWRAASQQLVGLRQQLRDAIQSALTAEEIEAITWPPSNLPT